MSDRLTRLRAKMAEHELDAFLKQADHNIARTFRPRVAAETLTQYAAAIDEHAGLLGLNVIGRSGDFTACGACDGNFHKVFTSWFGWPAATILRLRRLLFTDAEALPSSHGVASSRFPSDRDPSGSMQAIVRDLGIRLHRATDFYEGPRPCREPRPNDSPAPVSQPHRAEAPYRRRAGPVGWPHRIGARWW